MFNEQSFLPGPAQRCMDPHYNMPHPMNQLIYNTNYNMHLYHNYENFREDIEQSNNMNEQRHVHKEYKIAITKNALTSAYKLNEKLKTICEELRNDNNLTEDEWRQKINICNTAKEEIVKLLDPIRDKIFMNDLKKNLARRKKKRLREKLKKEKWRNEKALKIEQRARLHAQIDSWIRKEQAVIDKEKQEEKLRKDADMILFDVRGKRSDARKYLGLLQELRNLRTVKANIARARGEHLSSAVDEAFNNIIAKLTEQWAMLDREYSIEEQGLKLMLKTDNEERIRKRRGTIFDEWEKVLFGKKITDQYNMDLTNFITLRRAWDKYISLDNDASSIPIGWVMPHKPSSAAWQKCLKIEMA